MPQGFLVVSFLILVGLSVDCSGFSDESIRTSSSSDEISFLDSKLLPQGVAVGDVSSERALLWLRTDGPAQVRVEYAPPSLWEQASKLATAVAPVPSTALIRSTAETDYTLTVHLGKLSPGTLYRYHVTVADEDQSAKPFSGKLAAKGEFITLPDNTTSTAVTFAWSGDLGGQGRCRQGVGGYPIFDVIHRQDPDFFLFLGDTIYSDHICLSPPNEPGADFSATTLQTYRERHRYQRGAESLQRFLRTVPVYVIWDDHDVRDNFSGPFDAQMPAGRQALREYWPIASPEQDPHRLYRSVRYGANLELFILDTRQYRSRNEDQDGPDKTMLGSGQLQWLLDELQRSTAIWKVIVTSVPLSVVKGSVGNDGWGADRNGVGFVRERQMIVDTILGQKVRNVVFLAGDVHWVQANAYDPDQDGIIDFHEFMVGPLSARPGRLTPASEDLHPTRLVNESGYQNFGLVRVTRSSFDVTVIDEAGETRFSHHISAPEP
ncbi:MAG: alkaline phosphatase D family protein [Nitrospira sp.]|nr:alkaline phosphatase D family protein [Nitrospira sp.]